MKQFLILPFMFFTLASSCYAASDQKVEKLFEVTGVEAQLNGGFEAMLPMVNQMAIRLNLDANEKQELTNIYRAWFVEDIDHSRIMDKMKEIYAKSFTNEEAEEIIEFYQTPTAQKFVKKAPELMKLGAKIGMEEAASKRPQLMSRLKPFFEKHAKDHQ